MVSANSYWRSKLSPAGQRVYDELLFNLSRGYDRANISYSIMSREISKCYNAVMYDNPQYFWQSPEMRARTHGRQTCVEFSPLYRSRDIQAITSVCENIASRVKGSSEIETEINIAEYLCRNAVYEIDMRFNQNMAAALYYKKAQCSGISSAVKYLCDQNNVWCIIASGFFRGDKPKPEPHAWNVVNIGGNFYHLDVTNMMGYNLDNPKELRFAYFNQTDDMVANTHTWDGGTLPICNQKFDISKVGGSAQVKSKMQTSVMLQEFTNLAELRTAIEKAITGSQEQLRFTLKLGASVEETQKLIMSSIKMVMSKLRKAGATRVETTGNISTIYF